MSKLKEILLEEDVEYKFAPHTHQYGNAEFVVCPVFKRGKLREFYMFPAQQPNAKHYYKKIFEGKNTPLDFSISSWSYKGIESPRIWLNFWCKEHKCHSFKFYVPKNSNFFTIGDLSNFSVNFDFEEEEE